MAKKKTYKDYEADIRKFHAAGDFDKLWRRVDKWAGLVPLTFLIANNEQLPYTEELIELGHEVAEMPEKALLGFQQTSDYLCYIAPYKRYTGVMWERKSPDDAINTFVHGQDRFYAELKRACENPLVDYMLIGVECTRDKFISMGHMSAVKKTITTKDAKGKSVKRKVVVKDSNGKPKTAYSAGATAQSRLAIVESIGPRTLYKVNIRWHSARKYAVNDLVKQNRMWLKYNYVKVLGLNDE